MDKQSIIDKLERLGYMICDATNNDLVFALSDEVETIDIREAFKYDDVNTRYILMSCNRDGHYGILSYECEHKEDVSEIYAIFDWYTFGKGDEDGLLETFASQVKYTTIKANVEQCSRLALYRYKINCLDDDELLCLYNESGCIFDDDTEEVITNKQTDSIAIGDEYIYITAVVQIVPDKDLFDGQIEQALVQLNERIDNEHKAE